MKEVGTLAALDGLRAQILAQHGSNYSKTDNGNRPVVLLQRSDRAAVHRHKICSPADAAYNRDGSKDAQQWAAGFFLWSTWRTECSPILIPLAGACAPVVLKTFLRHAPNLTQVAQKHNRQNLLEP